MTNELYIKLMNKETKWEINNSSKKNKIKQYINQRENEKHLNKAKRNSNTVIRN